MGFGSAAYGYAASIIATTLTQPSFFEAMNLATASNADALIGATNGLFYTGGIFGSFCCGWMSTTYGRKISATFGALLILISSALLTVAVNMGMFITFRFFTGWGCFQLLATVPLWIAEIAPPKIRGILVDIHPVMVNFGYTCASYVGIGFYYYTGGGKNTWRGPMGLSMVFPTIFLSGVYWLPESPRFLLSKDRIEEAWAIIHRLHSDTSDPTDEFAKREFYQTRKQIELDLSMSSPTITASYIQILRKASTRKRAFITMFLTFAQMSSGAIVINNYGGLIYTQLGYSTASVLQFQGGYQLTAWVMNMVAMLFVDRAPRPYLLATDFFTSMLTVIATCALQKNFLHTTNHARLAACVAMLFLNTTCYCLFLEGPAFSYAAKIWPSHFRGQGYALAMGMLALTCIVWLQSAPTAFATIGWKFYILFIIVGAIATVAMLLFYPDTLHKPLEEVAALFGDEDLVAVYQKDLDNHTKMPVDVLDAAIPGEKDENIHVSHDEVERAV